MRRFPKEVVGENTFVWRYHKALPDLATNTKNVGLEGDFYGRPGSENEADTKITEVDEPPHASLLADLQATTGDVQDVRIAPFIAQFSGRTKNLRLAFTESSEFLVDEISKAFGDPDRLAEMILTQCKKPGYLEEMIRKEVPPELATPQFMQLLMANAPMLMKEFAEKVKHEASRQAVVALEKQKPKLIEHAALGQIRAMNRIDDNAATVQGYRQFKWSVHPTESPLVLGDSGCFFIIAGETNAQPFPEAHTKIKEIYFPIASHRFLLGRKTSGATMGPEDINLASVRCSREFFISSQGPEVHGRYKPELGHNAVFFSREKIAEISQQSFDELQFGQSVMKIKPQTKNSN